MPRPASILVTAATLIFATHARAETPSCPPVTTSPGVVRAAVEGRREPVGQVAVTYSVSERSVCAAFTANPNNAKDIRPGMICYDVSVYGRLTQRGAETATATLLDGSVRALRLDRESEIQMSMAYMAYSDECSGLRPQPREPSL